MPIAYREDHDIDLEQLGALFVTAGWGWRANDRERLAQMVHGARFAVHAWDGERLVGFARAISDGVSNAYVSTVGVLPEYRGRGIGRELMQRLLSDRDDITFSLHTAQRDVQPFYEKCGFERSTAMMRRPRKE